MNKELFNQLEKLRVRVELVRDGSLTTKGPTIKTPDDVYVALKHLRYYDREHFISLYLNTRNMIIGIETVSVGSLDSNVVHPREVLKGAILASAAGIILGHNHPSGDVTPSEDDKKITKRIKEACELISIELLDHIIIGDGDYLSMKERGLV